MLKQEDNLIYKKKGLDVYKEIPRNTVQSNGKSYDILEPIKDIVNQAK